MASQRILLPGAILLFAAYAAVMLISPADTSAFVPLGLTRRDMVQAVTGAGVFTMGSEAVFADAQGEAPRALKVFAPQVYALKAAAESGECEKILKKENKFKL